jgi:hypothetical protein
VFTSKRQNVFQNRLFGVAKPLFVYGGVSSPQLNSALVNNIHPPSHLSGPTVFTVGPHCLSRCPV